MGDWNTELMEKIDRRDARVVIIGLGYVGLPLALEAVRAGFEVRGVEIDPQRRDTLAKFETEVDGIEPEDLRAAIDSGRWRVDGDFQAVGTAQVVVICVPTPLLAGLPDLSAVLDSVDSIARYVTRGTLVSLESTTYPGTTEEIVRPRLEASGLMVGPNLALVFSPERIDPGNIRFGLRQIPKLVGGVTRTCTELGAAFYSAFVSHVVPLDRPREAEMAKLLENTYRQVNIALINEFAMVAHELDVDIWEVVDAAATKPFGFEPFQPGIGIGGHCIAVDPVYLTWRIRELGRAPFRLVELAQEVDKSMPVYVARRVSEVLLADGIKLDGAKVFALGVTYKPDVADLRTSRAVDVMVELAAKGCSLAYHDPFHDQIEVGDLTLKASRLGSLKDSDVAVILTHHSSYDWNEIVSQAPRVFDARGVTRGIDNPRIARL